MNTNGPSNSLKLLKTLISPSARSHLVLYRSCSSFLHYICLPRGSFQILNTITATKHSLICLASTVDMLNPSMFEFSRCYSSGSMILRLKLEVIQGFGGPDRATAQSLSHCQGCSGATGLWATAATTGRPRFRPGDHRMTLGDRESLCTQRMDAFAGVFGDYAYSSRFKIQSKNFHNLFELNSLKHSHNFK